MGNIEKCGMTGKAVTFLVSAIFVSRAAFAADGGGPPPATAELNEVTVTAAKMRSLEQFTPTGSRLGLSAQELPASLDVIDNDEMIGRGFFNVQQAAVSQPGVSSGGSPGDQSQFS